MSKTQSQIRIVMFIIAITLLLYSTIIVITASTVATVSETNVAGNPTDDSVALNFVPHDPISITADADFDAFPGSGTAEDPYIIEGYNITTSSDYAIYIADTTKYFVIRNCYVMAKQIGIHIRSIATGTAKIINNTCVNSYIGIYLLTSSNSTIVNNTCSNNSGYGIVTDYSSSLFIKNNTCTNNNDTGIYLYYADSSIVANNTCVNNTNNGIYLHYSGSSIAANNTCKNNEKGIYLHVSGSSTVANNTCIENYYGIETSFSESIKLVNNTFIDCGLVIYEDDVSSYKTYVVEHNLVNNKLLGFFIDLPNIVIEQPNYGQIIIINCSNAIIRNQVLSYCTIGLYSYYSFYLSISNNTATNNDIGMYLSNSPFAAITNNTCKNNNIGLKLVYSGPPTVVNNTFTKNDMGIFLVYTSSATVKNNLIWYNYNYGVKILDASKCLLFHNIFINNNAGGSSQAYDDSKDNFWYNSNLKEGNYWSDWSGTDSYTLDGAGNSDLYPVVDIDNDNLTETAELFEHHTDPFSPDTDSDGMPDGWEIQYKLNPLSNADANGDLDNDGLTNVEEYQYNTDPTKNDTDGDGLSDSQEVKEYGTNPTKTDTDGDGLNDAEEVNTYGTNPTKTDTDGDGYSDFEEIQAGTNPLDPEDHPTPTTEITTSTGTNKATTPFVFVILTLISLVTLISALNKVRILT